MAFSNTRPRTVLFAVVLFIGMLMLFTSRAEAASLSFIEDFEGTALGPNLEDPDGAYLVDDVIRKTTPPSTPEDPDGTNRSYVRTVRTDYSSIEWTYTIDFDFREIDESEIVFIGVGAGERNPGNDDNEPGNAVFFRIHNQNAQGGAIDVAVVEQGEFVEIEGLGEELSDDGLYTARIEKIGVDLEFSIDDVDRVVVIEIPSFLNDNNSRLFFGNAGTFVEYDNMVVEAEEEEEEEEEEPGANTPPSADAGPDQPNIEWSPDGPEVTLDGSGSSDSDNGDSLTYSWTGPFLEGSGTVTGVDPTVTLQSLGQHTITLDVDDGNGGTDTDTVTITVVDTTSPVITLVGSDPVSVQLGSAYIDPGSIASDNVDGDITANIVTFNPVDVNTVGSYTVTYDVSDSSGNPATQVSRTVTVIGPQDLKQGAVEGLTPYEGESKKIGKAIKKINKSLETKLWVDTTHLDAKHGKKVFDKEKHAVKELMKVVKDEAKGKDNVSDDALVAAEAAIADLVAADRILAEIALDQARNTPVTDPKKAKKVAKEIEKAEKELAKAQDKLDKGKPDKAVDKYKKA